VGAFPNYSGADGGATPPESRTPLHGQVQTMMRLVAKMFLTFGLVIMGVGAYLAWTELNPDPDWPRVTGVVTNGQLAGEAGDASGPVYRVWLQFRFTAGGKEYLGNTGDSWISNDRSVMEWELRRYTIGSSHVIRYNPANPTEVRLEAATTAKPFAPAMYAGGIGLCMVVVSLFGLVSKPGQQVFPQT